VQWEYWDEKDNTWEPDAIWQKLKRQWSGIGRKWAGAQRRKWRKWYWSGLD
jgi:hypothetical protein